MGNGLFQKMMLRDFAIEKNSVVTKPTTAVPSRVCWSGTSSKTETENSEGRKALAVLSITNHLLSEWFSMDKTTMPTGLQIQRA